MSGSVCRSCVVLVALLAVWVPLVAAAEPPGFAFTDVDLRLLAEVELLDQRLERDGLVVADASLTAYVTRVGESVLPEGPAPERVEWRFRVLRDSLPNAFALPNGSIYVHSGLLGVIENEDQLAGVLAHEAAHVLERHTYRAFRSYRRRSTAISFLGLAAGVAPVEAGWGRAISLIAGTTQIVLAFTIEGYSRELEREADRHAVDALRASDYDVGELAQTFRLLQGTHDLETETFFYNSHPKLEERVAAVTALAGDDAPLADEASQASRRDSYRRAIVPVSRHNVQLAIDSRRHRSAVALAQRLVDEDPHASEHALLLAEAYRALGPRTPQATDAERSSSGRREAQRLRQRLTVIEEEQTRLSRPEGEAAWRENQQRSEEWYWRALELDPANGRAHRGLGLLFEHVGRRDAAIDAYRRYLESAPAPADRARIERRLEALVDHAGPSR